MDIITSEERELDDEEGVDIGDNHPFISDFLRHWCGQPNKQQSRSCSNYAFAKRSSSKGVEAETSCDTFASSLSAGVLEAVTISSSFEEEDGEEDSQKRAKKHPKQWHRGIAVAKRMAKVIHTHLQVSLSSPLASGQSEDRFRKEQVKNGAETLSPCCLSCKTVALELGERFIAGALDDSVSHSGALLDIFHLCFCSGASSLCCEEEGGTISSENAVLESCERLLEALLAQERAELDLDEENQKKGAPRAKKRLGNAENVERNTEDASSSGLTQRERCTLAFLSLSTIIERILYEFFVNATSTAPAMILRDLLGWEGYSTATTETSEAVQDPLFALLKVLFLPRGLNLRNLLWHGFMDPSELDPAWVSLTLSATLLLIQKRYPEPHRERKVEEGPCEESREEEQYEKEGRTQRERQGGEPTNEGKLCPSSTLQAARREPFAGTAVSLETNGGRRRACPPPLRENNAFQQMIHPALPHLLWSWDQQALSEGKFSTEGVKQMKISHEILAEKCKTFHSLLANSYFLVPGRVSLCLWAIDRLLYYRDPYWFSVAIFPPLEHSLRRLFIVANSLWDAEEGEGQAGSNRQRANSNRGGLENKWKNKEGRGDLRNGQEPNLNPLKELRRETGPQGSENDLKREEERTEEHSSGSTKDINNSNVKELWKAEAKALKAKPRQRTSFSVSSIVFPFLFAHVDEYYSTLDGFGQKRKHQVLLDKEIFLNKTKTREGRRGKEGQGLLKEEGEEQRSQEIDVRQADEREQGREGEEQGLSIPNRLYFSVERRREQEKRRQRRRTGERAHREGKAEVCMDAEKKRESEREGGRSMELLPFDGYLSALLDLFMLEDGPSPRSVVAHGTMKIPPLCSLREQRGEQSAGEQEKDSCASVSQEWLLLAAVFLGLCALFQRSSESTLREKSSPKRTLPPLLQQQQRQFEAFFKVYKSKYHPKRLLEDSMNRWAESLSDLETFLLQSLTPRQQNLNSEEIRPLTCSLLTAEERKNALRSELPLPSLRFSWELTDTQGETVPLPLLASSSLGRSSFFAALPIIPSFATLGNSATSSPAPPSKFPDNISIRITVSCRSVETPASFSLPLSTFSQCENVSLEVQKHFSEPFRLFFSQPEEQQKAEVERDERQKQKSWLSVMDKDICRHSPAQRSVFGELLRQLLAPTVCKSEKEETERHSPSFSITSASYIFSSSEEESESEEEAYLWDIRKEKRATDEGGESVRALLGLLDTSYDLTSSLLARERIEKPFALIFSRSARSSHRKLLGRYLLFSLPLLLQLLCVCGMILEWHLLARRGKEEEEREGRRMKSNGLSTLLLLRITGALSRATQWLSNGSNERKGGEVGEDSNTQKGGRKKESTSGRSVEDVVKLLLQTLTSRPAKNFYEYLVKRSGRQED